MTTICLNMIVKNESHCIIETLQSVYKYINFYVICDTGSTDNTIDLIKSFFNDKGIDGKIYHDKWKDFGYNRTIAIKRCKGHCNYIWTIDADDLLIGNINLNSLSHDCYYLQYGKNLKYKRRQIFINNNSLQWSYTGKLHEQLTCNKKDYTSSIIIGDYYIMSRRLGNRNKDPNKYQHDISILISELKHNPNSPRTVFYLANSFRDNLQYDKAIEYYNKRINMKGNEEQIYHSYYQIGNIYTILKKPSNIIEKAYIDTYKFYPKRWEPLYRLARLYRLQNKYDLSYKYCKIAVNIPFPKDDLLNIEQDVYDYKLYDELSIASFYVDKYIESYKYCNKLLSIDHSIISNECRNRIKNNIKFSINKIHEIGKDILVFHFGNQPVNNNNDLLNIINNVKSYYDIYIDGYNININNNDYLQTVKYIDDRSLSKLPSSSKYILVDNLNTFLLKSCYKFNSNNVYLLLLSPILKIQLDNNIDIEVLDQDLINNVLQSINVIFYNETIYQKFKNKYNYEGLPYIFNTDDTKYLHFLDNDYKSNNNKITIDDSYYKKGGFDYKLPSHIKSIRYSNNKYTRSTYHNILKDIIQKVNTNPYTILELVKYYIHESQYDRALNTIMKLYDLTDDNRIINLIKIQHGNMLSKNKEYELSYYKFNEVLNSNLLSDKLQEDISMKRDINIDHFKDNYLQYPTDKITNIIQNKKDINNIVFTITTCKRYDLFEKTINSFLNCCLDYNLIDQWICIDDNSSQEDRDKMKNQYPFFKYIWKTPNEKGHYKSMNMIIDNLSPETNYVLHMEDDFHFIQKRNYITDGINILKHEKDIGQILFNKNYSEIPNYKMRIAGGINKCHNNIRYTIHEYYQMNTHEYKSFIAKHKKYLTVAYWKHFSFRPSIVKRSVYDDIGLFYNTGHFEMAYASEYIERGYSSAFFNDFTSIHIGKKTWEKNKPNSYKLNNTDQFVLNNKVSINILSDDIDQWKLFKEKAYNSLPYFNRCKGKDTINHINIWNKNKDELLLILNDDVNIVPNLIDKYYEMINCINTNKHDIIFIGTDDYIPSKDNIIEIVDVNPNDNVHGYLITKSGITKLLNFIKINLISQDIFQFLIKTPILSKYKVDGYL